MNSFWSRISKLDDELSLWVEEDELGEEKVVVHKRKQYFVRIPQEINKKITIRLAGLGKTRFRKTGDLYLHVWLNKGEDIQKVLWLSDSEARNGTNKNLFTGDRKITVLAPKNSHDGLTIRLKGLGKEPGAGQQTPALEHKKRGNLLVKLSVFPDQITPQYGSFDALSTEHMALEGWVYRKYDKVIGKLEKSSLPVNPVQANAIADLYNEAGWKSIFAALVEQTRLANLKIELEKSASITAPGSCERMVVLYNNTSTGTYYYKITIHEQFLDNPFAIAAILAHELCHVVYSERIDETPKPAGIVLKSEKATLEEERTVDLLVFMYKMGEFQLRVARDKRLTIGYFDQRVFERIQGFVVKKG